MEEGGEGERDGTTDWLSVKTGRLLVGRELAGRERHRWAPCSLLQRSRTLVTSHSTHFGQ